MLSDEWLFFSPRLSQNPNGQARGTSTYSFFGVAAFIPGLYLNHVKCGQGLISSASNSEALVCMLGDLTECGSTGFTSAKWASHSPVEKNPFRVWVPLPLREGRVLLQQRDVPSTCCDSLSSFLSIQKCDIDASLLGWETLSGGAREKNLLVLFVSCLHLDLNLLQSQFKGRSPKSTVTSCGDCWCGFWDCQARVILIPLH